MRFEGLSEEESSLDLESEGAGDVLALDDED